MTGCFHRPIFICSLVCLLISCTNKDRPLFELHEEIEGIDFINQLTYTEDFNPYIYRNFYNGGGVALGDINNDGLIDIYLTGNIVDNKLYLNKGDFKFEDITDEAGVACSGVWSAGATFADINGDGLLDLYVCKSGKPGGENRHNELFINQGDLTFNEESKKYGLDVTGLSVHSAFFDYDKDGDLDCYLLNNSIRSVGGFDLKEDQRLIHDPEGNKFFENQSGTFVDITTEIGIYSSNIGYGLGITLSDFNRDGWTDLFISNDFFERDYLYINQEGTSFTEKAESYFDALSLGSMGADAADLNNDNQIDLFVTEMLPESLERKKTKATYDSWDKYVIAVDKGYYHQYPRNMLQRSYGAGGFLEIGRYSGVAASEWSWASLIADLDNDGLKDIFISNGIHKDLLDRDYLAYMEDQDVMRQMGKSGGTLIMQLIDLMPSTPISNKCYKNLNDFQFADVSQDWGMDQLTFSNGSAYGDLDNDGDIDLIVNNVNMPVYIYENHTDTAKNRSLMVRLIGKDFNKNAIGATMTIKRKGQDPILIENYVTRGFQSSISHTHTVGVGQSNTIDTMVINWPNNEQSLFTDLATNELHTIQQENETDTYKNLDRKRKELLRPVKDLPIHFRHKENNFNEFSRERLLFKMTHNEGPGTAVADVNGDGRKDVFFGGAKNQSSELFVSVDSSYIRIVDPFSTNYKSEVNDALFFDCDNDGDLDLYVANGGKAFSIYSRELDDQLYLNDGKGNFSQPSAPLQFQEAIASSTVSIIDVNQDGLNDIFIGERYHLLVYGKKGSGYVLMNKGAGQFQLRAYDELKNIGMITSSAVLDFEKDGIEELVVVGEWMDILVFRWINEVPVNVTDTYFTSENIGLWQVVRALDLDKDGDKDLVCGNIGVNSFIQPGSQMLVGDLDYNGSTEQIFSLERNGKYYPIHDMDELTAQLPHLKKIVPYYKDYAQRSVGELFGLEELTDSESTVLTNVRTQAYLNNNGVLEQLKLPEEIQYSIVYDVYAVDIDRDGVQDLVAGGNQYLVKPQFGRYDASHGWVFFGNYNSSGQYQLEKAHKLEVRGQIRRIGGLDNQTLLFTLNDDESKIFSY